MFQGGTSDPAASSKRHPDPRALGGSGSRSPRRTGCLELTASALGSDGRPLPARTPRASGEGGKANPRSAERPGHANGTGPGAPGPAPASVSPAPSGRRRTAARLQRRKLLHLLFVSLRVWRGSGTALDPDPDTDFPPPRDGASRAPRSTQLFGELSSHPAC